MKINFTENFTIKELNKIFSDEFPFLKIEIENDSGSHRGFKKRQTFYINSTILHSISRKIKNEFIEFTPLITVLEFESMCKSQLGINLQVFRQSGSAWLETTATDSWTLKKQNEFGKMLSEKEREPINEFDNDVVK